MEAVIILPLLIQHHHQVSKLMEFFIAQLCRCKLIYPFLNTCSHLGLINFEIRMDSPIRDKNNRIQELVILMPFWVQFVQDEPHFKKKKKKKKERKTH